MWVVSQNRTEVLKSQGIYLTNEHEGTREIRVVYNNVNTHQNVESVGEYPDARAKDIFEHMINNIGNADKYEMPKE